MPGTAPSAPTASRARRRWVDVALLVLVVALFAVPLTLRLGSSGAPGGERYGGTDNQAQQVVTSIDPGYRPWFAPLFRPAGGSVESGLFALQAALGAGAFGFALGRLSARRPGRPLAGDASGDPATGAAGGPVPDPAGG